MKEKRRIGIWFGGCSTEYEVSLQSASAVIQHLDYNKYEAVLIGIDRDGAWYLYNGPVEKIEEDAWRQDIWCRKASVSMDKKYHGLWVQGEKGLEVVPLDAAFPVLHGKNGEDGTLQGALELAGIPVVGCSTLSSAVCMEKDMAHRLAAQAGVKAPKAYMFAAGEVEEELTEYRLAGKNTAGGELRAASFKPAKIWEAAGDLGYPLFVKPVRAGSSFGITRVTEEGMLYDAVLLAFEHDSFCILEEAIDGFEVGCAVLGHPWEQLTVGEVDEIELSQGFFDYTEKYTLKTSEIHVPARIGDEKAQEIKRAAEVLYRALGCDYFARVDMFLNSRGEIYFNEINTIPGFTSHSRYPSMMKAAGISFEEVIDRLLDMAFDREV